MRVGIINYELGNISSIKSAIEKVGGQVLYTNKTKSLLKCDRLILPGVGAFKDGMKNLKKHNLINRLHDLVIEDKVPIFGICLGFQLFAKSSTEFGFTKGLGWIDAQVVKIKPKNKNCLVPHVGWNSLKKVRDHKYLKGISKNPLFYFVHSYQMVCNNKADIFGFTNHGVKIIAVVSNKNIFGTQFHPEKSQKDGLKVLENFLFKKN